MQANTIRKFLIVALILILIVVIGINVVSLVRPETGYNTEEIPNGAVFPSFTICPFMYTAESPYNIVTKGQNKTFQNLLDSVPPAQDVFKMAFLSWADIWEQKYLRWKLLTDEKAIKEKFGVEASDIVIEGVRTSLFPPYHLVRCVTYNVPKTGLTPKTHALTLGLKMEGMFIVLIETHDPGNSLHNHNFDFRRIYMVSPQLEFRYVSISSYRTTKQNLWNQPCDAENLQRNTDCMNDFLSENYLHCYLPWTKKPRTGLKACTSPQDLDKLIELHENLTNLETKQRIRDHGCYVKPNCRQNHWKLENLADAKFYMNKVFGNNSSTLFFMALDNTLVETKQVLLYSFANFICDSGGIMGLLLGASILSLYDVIMDSIVSTFRRRKI